jgi:hypothetical protein
MQRYNTHKLKDKGKDEIEKVQSYMLQAADQQNGEEGLHGDELL